MGTRRGDSRIRILSPTIEVQKKVPRVDSTKTKKVLSTSECSPYNYSPTVETALGCEIGDWEWILIQKTADKKSYDTVTLRSYMTLNLVQQVALGSEMN